MWIEWRWVSVCSQTGCGMATPETEVGRWIFSRKLIYLVTRWIKKRISPNIHYFSRTSKSPLLPTLSHHAKIQPCWTGNQNGRCDTANTCSRECRSWIVVGSGTPTVTSTFSGSSNTLCLLWLLSDVGVTGKSKMAAINRKYLLQCPMSQLVYEIPRRFKRLPHIFVVQYYGGTSANTL